LGDENYVQILASRKFGKSREVSSEFDSIQAIRYNRDALRWQKLPLVVVDELSAETLVRGSDNASFGWSGSSLPDTRQERPLAFGNLLLRHAQGHLPQGKTTVFITEILTNGKAHWSHGTDHSLQGF